MAHIFEDRIFELSTSTGTGDIALAGAVTAYRTFSSVLAIGDTLPYMIEAVDSNGRPTGDYEYGLGTYSATNTITRTTVRGSSNAGSPVNFAVGTKFVQLAVCAPASAAAKAEWRAIVGAGAGIGANNDITSLNGLTTPLSTAQGGTGRNSVGFSPVRQAIQSGPIGGDSSNVTITNATPAVITYTAHGKEANSPLSFATTGGLPTGLATNTTYFVSSTGLTANTFQVSATAGGASIATSSAGTGVHTATFGSVATPVDPLLLGGALGGTTITTSNVSATNPLQVSAAMGFDASGAIDIVGRAAANLTWTTLNTNGTWGIFVDVSTGGALAAVNGCLPLPIYQSSGNFSSTAGQLVFNYALMIGKVGSGVAAVQSSRVCIGEVTVAGGVVTAIVWYDINDQFDTGWFTVSANANYTKNANVGKRSPFRILVSTTATGLDGGGTEADPGTGNGDGPNSNYRGVLIDQFTRNVVRVRTQDIFQIMDSSGATSNPMPAYVRLIGGRTWK